MPEPTIEGYHSFVKIGRGGLGDVYRAVEWSTGATVAVKVLRDVSDSSLAWHRTRRELRALAALRGHPNVIESIDLIELDGSPALVMEYAAGGSVADMLRDREASGSGFGADEAAFVARQTATALVAAHARGIVHRDIKPQNLLVDGQGQIKLCDFGIAALTHDEDYRTRTNAVSTRYASPEDLEADAPVGPATDIYSLGATLLHLVHGAPPTLRDRLTPWDAPLTHDPARAAFDAVIAHCLQPEPAQRPTASELLESLRRLDSVDSVDRLAAAGNVSEAPLIRFDDAPMVDREATTVRRPSRRGAPVEPERPVMVARPKIRVASRRSVLAGVAAAAVIVVAMAAIVFRARDGEAAAGLVTEPRPSALTSLTGADWSAGEVGDCLVQVPDHAELQVVECTRPHDLQRFATGQLTDDDAGRVATGVESKCAAAFTDFVGIEPERSELDIARTRPSAATWTDGDRAFHCYLGIEAQRVVGDARATGW